MTGKGVSDSAPNGLALMEEASLAPNRVRLPRQLTSFVGREHQLTEVTRALRDHRLLTI